MSKLNQLKAEGKLVGWWDIRKHSLLEQTGRGGAITVSAGSVGYANTRFGRAILQKTGSRLVTSSYSAIEISGAMTAIVFGDMDNVSAYSANTSGIAVVMDKKDAGGSHFYWYKSQSSHVFTDGTTSSSLSFSGGKMNSVVIGGAGQKPKFYKNGIYQGEGNNAVTVTADDAALTLGQSYSVDVYSHTLPVCSYMIFNVALTDQEISEIYNELSTQRGMGDPKTSNYRFNPEPIQGSVLSFDTQKTADGKLADLSGNNKNGTLTGMVLATQDGIKRLQPTGATPKVDFGTPLSSSVTKATLECVIGGSQFIFGNKTATVRFCIRKIAGYIYTYAEGGGGNYGNLADTNTDIRHMALVYDGSGAANADRLKLYINNVEQTLSFTGTIPATLGDMSARNVLLNEDTGGTYGDGKYVYGNLIEEALSSTEVANRYAQFAKHAVYQSESHKWLPTLANVTAGQIGNSGWEVRDGTWNIVELEDTKLIASSAGIGRAILPNQKRAYGTWVFEIYRPNTTTDISVYLVNDETANNGIMLNFYYDEGIYLKRTLAGATATLAWTSASYIENNVVYKVAVSRSTTGEITMYIKGGAYTKWQKITVAGGGTNPVTYTSITASEKSSLYSSAGMDFNFLGIHQGVLGIPELSGMY